jgi:phage RecT family recombinase
MLTRKDTTMTQQTQQQRSNGPTATRPVLYQDWTQPFEVALYDARQELSRVLRDEGATDQFINAVWLHMRRTPTLQQCSPASIQAAAAQLALSGLDITQPGEAWLIPLETTKRGTLLGKDEDGRNKYEWTKELECVVWDGYLGRLKLARQSPGVVDAWGAVVREGETYRYRGYGMLPQHDYPEGFETERGPVQGAYAVVQCADGRVKCLQMSKTEILAHRDQYARAAESDVWQERLYEWKGSGRSRQRVEKGENRSFEKMCLKVVTNQLCHPRHVAMPRHAAAIIARQEQAIAEHLTPQTGVTAQPQQPVPARPEAITEVWGADEGPEKTALLATIKAGFAEVVVPLLPKGEGRSTLAHVCFGVNDWKDLPAIPLTRLKQGMPRWAAALRQLKAGVPGASDQWTAAEWMTWLLADEQASEAADEETTGEPTEMRALSAALDAANTLLAQYEGDPLPPPVQAVQDLLHAIDQQQASEEMLLPAYQHRADELTAAVQAVQQEVTHVSRR